MAVNSDLGAIVAYLKTVSAVTNLVQVDRIWSVGASDRPTALPNICLISGNSPDYPMFSNGLLVQSNFVIVVDAIGLASANQILAVCCDALDSKSGLTFTDARGVGTILGFVGGGGSSGESPLPRSDNRKVFTSTKDFLAWIEVV